MQKLQIETQKIRKKKQAQDADYQTLAQTVL